MPLSNILAFTERDESSDAEISAEVVACAVNNRTFQER